ncbi:MAG: HTTM domain-containing protein [Anaerolineae bacterium]|nr:HTTM domain-containing protein [Anaerolineae bacterium]
MTIKARLTALRNTWLQPIPIGALVFARIAFGLIMLWEVERYFTYERVARYYIDPIFHFHYTGFHWLQPLPGDGMVAVFLLLGMLSLAIALGAFYRLSIAAFWVLFTYVFLLDAAQYLNHFYLVSLLSFLMIWVPANRAFSVDVWLGIAEKKMLVPAWTLYILRLQMGMVYFFGGIAKMNPDWLSGEPLRTWLGARTDFPLIGHLFTEDWAPYVFSYGGLLLDLLIAPLLLWRRTRLSALLLVIGFHVTNSQLFNIGIFPWMSIALTLLFLPPEWFSIRKVHHEQTLIVFNIGRQQKLLFVILGGFSLMQVLLPLRHFFMPGYASWTEEGHNLAWHMRLRDKEGDIRFFASDPMSGETREISASDYLTDRQFEQMIGRPEMVLRFAHYLAATDYQGMQIRVWDMVSLNARAPQLLIDPTVDLATTPDDLGIADWILPLVQPLAVENAEGVPAILFNRHSDDILLFINITEQPFLLDHLLLDDGNRSHPPISFDTATLHPENCMVLHTAQADWENFSPICNEAGRYLMPDGLADYALWLNDEKLEECDGATCIIVAPDKDN